MVLFDVNVCLGRSANPAGGSFDRAADLLGEMKRLGIGQALVCHSLAMEADVVKGNRLLMEELKGRENLYPCWVMAPSVLGDLPEPEAWIREAVGEGVRAVRLVPRHSLYSLSDWSVGRLLGAAEGAKLPVLLDYGVNHWSESVIPWDEIHAVCQRHPGLAVVVLGVTIGQTRDAVQSLHRLPNLYLAYHTFNAPDVLRLMARGGLAGRLLFGTGMPLRAGECVVEQTRLSGLKDDQLRAVAGGNARRLLGLEEPPGCPFAVTTAAGTAAPQELRAADRGIRPVIDVHAHVGSWERTITPVKGAEAIVADMDRCGIDKMVFSSFSAIHGGQRVGNQETADAVRRCPGRLYGYAVINPNYPAEADDELKRCFDGEKRFVGLKLHCQLHKAQLHDKGYERAMAFANERHLPVLVHGGGQDRWAEVARRYPGAAFIMAHGCAWDGVDPAGRRLYAQSAEVENLYVDVAGSGAYRGALRALAGLVGVQKILFGSDFPMYDLAFEAGRITLSDLDEKDKAAVCGGNALRIFRGL